MPYGYSNATPKEIEKVVSKLCELYPDISKSDHHMIADITYGNYFSKNGLFSWYVKTAQKLTSKVLETIRIDPHFFFYAESHLAAEGGYIPLAERNDIDSINNFSSAPILL